MGQEHEPITIEAAEPKDAERGILDGVVHAVTVRWAAPDHIHVPDIGTETHPPGSTTPEGQEAIEESMEKVKEGVRDSIAAQHRR